MFFRPISYYQVHHGHPGIITLKLILPGLSLPFVMSVVELVMSVSELVVELALLAAEPRYKYIH